MSEEKLVEELRNIRGFAVKSNRKKRNESDREFLIRTSRCRCAYCRMQFPKSKLSIVKKNPSKDYLSKMKNGIVACQTCANEKGPLSDKEYRAYLCNKKKDTRNEVYENYPEFSSAVFSKYQHECIYCIYEFGKTTEGVKLTIDHKVPVSRGGTNDEKNLCSSCSYHNSDKRDLTAEEYFRVLNNRKLFQDEKQL